MNALVYTMNKLEAAKASMGYYVQDTVGETKAEIEDKVTGQLSRGENAKAEPLRPEYQNPIYAALKQFMNGTPEHGTPDLKLTGDFHSSITAVITASGISLDAYDWKTDHLAEKYGQHIIGLSDRSLRELADELWIPYLKHRMKQEILK